MGTLLQDPLSPSLHWPLHPSLQCLEELEDYRSLSGCLGQDSRLGRFPEMAWGPLSQCFNGARMLTVSTLRSKQVLLFPE